MRMIEGGACGAASFDWNKLLRISHSRKISLAKSLVKLRGHYDEKIDR